MFDIVIWIKRHRVCNNFMLPNNEHEMNNPLDLQNKKVIVFLFVAKTSIHVPSFDRETAILSFSEVHKCIDMNLTENLF